MRDNLDWVLAQWQAERPDLDVSPMGVVGRVQRAARLLERGLGETFAEHGLQLWEFDILATLLRAGPPYQLSPGALSRASMVTAGAITNRLDRLAAKGLVDREPDPSSRRNVLVRLTGSGLALVTEALTAHLDNEVRLLSPLDEAEQRHLADLLRKLLTGLGDHPPASPAPPASPPSSPTP
ncbi:MarR family transcriptional regulator [Streptomyces sp. AJS327]|uniref:MarR family winged helix-turn-helix transcriptional regulator n=1 Tax=Streptomyces sp. AJS327 TaxID=2545265 RepID=UPI0015DEC0CA|nr:MarR family transcriptional regulator [Streptomyces sp. AJS327]MBA0053770.1 MarR family transcriptional regulator [Streptomyces sp. AJS327]